MLRKFTCLLMAFLLMMSMAIPAAQAADASVELVNQKDLKIAVTGTELNKRGDTLRLIAIVENNTGGEIDIFVEDAYLDGTEVKGYGIFDVKNGESRDDDYFMFKALDGESDAPLHGPTQYVFTLVVQNEDLEVLYSIPVRIASSLPEQARAPRATAKPTPKPTAAPANTYLELGFFEGAYAEWEDVGNDMFKLRVQVRNNSSFESIKAFELYMYATDVYGDRIYGEDQVYYETTKTVVGPREVVYSDYFTVPGRREADRVYIGVHRIVYSDGTVVEASKIDYWYWTLEWN